MSKDFSFALLDWHPAETEHWLGVVECVNPGCDGPEPELPEYEPVCTVVENPDEAPILPTPYARDVARILAAAPRLYRAAKRAYEWMKELEVDPNGEDGAALEALERALESLEGKDDG